MLSSTTSTRRPRPSFTATKGLSPAEPSSLATADILHAILATEISPELVPQETAGAIQSMEAMIGPYPLQDFNLFYLTRYGFRPSKIACLSWCAWSNAATGSWPSHIPAHEQRSYHLREIKHWLRLFLQRFFTNQFKRTAMPNGPRSRQAVPFRHGGAGAHHLMPAHQFGLRSSSETFRIKMTIDDLMMIRSCRPSRRIELGQKDCWG